MENFFKGLGVALVTPFSPDGSIDYEALGRIIEYQIGGGIDFMCALGSTAETPCLSAAERCRVKDYVVKVVNGRVPVLLGMGGNDTAALVREIEEFDFAGVSGILSVVPYYNKPSQEGMYQHFKAVAQAAGKHSLPVVLYNVPARTGVNMESDTTLRLARDFDNILAVKEASGKVEQIEAIASGAPQGFGVLSGDDCMTVDLIGRGACGVISVVGNAVPRTFGSMVRTALSGETKTAGRTDADLRELYGLVFREGNPAGIKALLSAKGLCANVLRLPLLPAGRETVARISSYASLN